MVIFQPIYLPHHKLYVRNFLPKNNTVIINNNNFEYLSRITLQYKVLLSTGSCKLDFRSQFWGGRKPECPEKTLEVRLRSTETQSTYNIVVEVEGVTGVHCASLTSQSTYLMAKPIFSMMQLSFWFSTLLSRLAFHRSCFLLGILCISRSCVGPP